MNFPDWAPTELIELYSRQLQIYEKDNSEGKFNPFDGTTNDQFCMHSFTFPFEKKAELIDLQYKHNIDNYKRQYNTTLPPINRWNTISPSKYSLHILKSLITDDRMMPVWKALDRRISERLMYSQFFGACIHGISEWMSSNKLTPKERKNELLDISNTAKNLIKLLMTSEEFRSYDLLDTIEKERMEFLAEVTGIEAYGINQRKMSLSSEMEKNISYLRFTLSDVIPCIEEILLDISHKADEFSKIKPIIKKPNSENASIHFFIRYLSGHLLATYQQPLHDVVASTVSVVFNADIESDFVRKIVK